MDCFMGSITNTDYIFQCKDTRIAIQDVIVGDRIQMVNDDRLKDFITFTSQITSAISDDNSITELFPFGRMIKSLIQIPSPTEIFIADAIPDKQIIKPFPKGWKLNKFGIAFIHSHQTSCLDNQTSQPSHQHKAPSVLALSRGSSSLLQSVLSAIRESPALCVL